jgi:predicted methyltransferase MtxX (methanogen marker protein 4)
MATIDGAARPTPVGLDGLLAGLRAAPPAILGAVGAAGPGAREALDTLREMGVGECRPYGADEEGIAAAVAEWSAGESALLLKLEASTAPLMAAVLRSARGGWFAHLGLVIDETTDRTFVLADAGLNRAPGVGDLLKIARRATEAARRLGVARPRLGLIAHREKRDGAVSGSVRLADLRERFGAELESEGVELVGPTSLDIAIDPDAALAKGVDGRPCDVLLAPDIIVGNVIYKSFMLRPDCVVAGAVFDGASGSLAVPSRAASTRERVAATAFAARLANDPASNRREQG